MNSVAELPPDWWPHRECSEFASIGGLRWHAQRWRCRRPQGGHAPAPASASPPLALLLHGTGSAAHSWRHLAPLLAEQFEVVAPDLPGHAFTLTPASQSLALDDVAQALATWIDGHGRRPALLVGHSAGAAVAMRLVLAGAVDPALVVAINGALLPLQGPVGRWFLPLARLLSQNPLVAPAFAAWASGPGATRRLLEGTGSTIDALGERCYARLVSDRRHAAGALRLMASWDLSGLQRHLGTLAVPLLLLVALGDRTLPPVHAQRVQALLPQADRVDLPGLGHLAHEEAAPRVAAPILKAWAALAAAVQTAEPQATPA